MKKILFALFSLLTLSAMRASAQDGATQTPAIPVASAPDQSAPGASTPNPTAQTSPARWSLGLAAGPAFPIGSFHRPAGTAAGPTAQNGGSAELSGSYHFCRSLGATLVVEGQENEGNGIAYWFYTPGAPKAAGSKQGNDWKMVRILTGAVYTLPLTKRTGPASKHTGPELLFRVLGGIQKTASPDYKTINYQYTSDAYTCLSCGVIGSAITYPGISFPWSFAYEADAGLQWRFNSRFSAVGNACYEGSKPSKNLQYIEMFNSTTGTYTTSYRRSSYATNTISLRAGIQYALSR